MLGLTSQTISAIKRIPVLIKTIQSDQSNPIYIQEEDGFSAKLSKKLFAHFQTGWSGRPDLTNGKHPYYSKMKNGTVVLETFGYIK